MCMCHRPKPATTTATKPAERPTDYCGTDTTQLGTPAEKDFRTHINTASK